MKAAQVPQFASGAMLRIFLLVQLAAAVTPVQKALEMLQGMLAKAKEGKHEEQIQYAAFKEFCSNSELEKQTAIQKADEKIETHKAHILKFDTEAERLGTEIVGHKSDMEGWSNDTKAAAAVRQTEREDYAAMHQNYSESISALTEAISVLKKEAYDRAGNESAAALLQATAAIGKDALPKDVERAVSVFLAEEPDIAIPYAYQFRSHDIVSLLESLKDKFRDKLTELEKEEMSRRHAHETLTQNLKHSIDAAAADVADKTKAESKNKEQSAETSASLMDLQDTRAADDEYLSDLVQTCQTKTSDYESRQKLRDDEIDALSKAITIISSNVVAGAADTHLPKAAALLRKNSTSFAQVRSTSSSAPSGQAAAKVAAFLRHTSERLNSRALSALAVRAQEDPFAKVKQLIEELLERLIAQAGEEETHKGWCDSELATNEHTRTTKTEEVNLLTIETETLQTSIASLANDIAELSAAVAQINADVAKATEMRNEEKAHNEQTLQDARDAQTAMSEAISILTDFYGKAAGATVLMQGRGAHGKQAPPIFDAPYKGLQSESGGVLGMLEVIQSDFARLESDTASSEEAAQEQYDKFMDESSTDKAQKEKDMEHKKSDKQSKEMDLVTKQSDLENAGNELSAAQATYEKLKPACLDAGVTYGERVARREEEIEALKEALRILSGEDAAVIQGVLVKDQGGASQLRSDVTGLDYAP